MPKGHLPWVIVQGTQGSPSQQHRRQKEGGWQGRTGYVSRPLCLQGGFINGLDNYLGITAIKLASNRPWLNWRTELEPEGRINNQPLEGQIKVWQWILSCVKRELLTVKTSEWKNVCELSGIKSWLYQQCCLQGRGRRRKKTQFQYGV